MVPLSIPTLGPLVCDSVVLVSVVCTVPPPSELGCSVVCVVVVVELEQPLVAPTVVNASKQASKRMGPRRIRSSKFPRIAARAAPAQRTEFNHAEAGVQEVCA